MFKEFLGYRRVNGAVGVRNYVAILPSVVCANEVASSIASRIDCAVPILHHQGCAQLPPDLKQITRTLIGLGRNPNVAAVLVVSLGCESVSADEVVRGIAGSGKPVEKIVIQDLGGSIRATEEGLEILGEMALSISDMEREPFNPSNLTVGVKCGGSDTTSGIASNPAAGVAVDTTVNRGGKVIFGETTEIFGAEHILAKCAVDEKVAAQIYQIVEKMESRILRVGVDMRGGQPTPGNIAGGITTIEEKSLGAIAKAGSSPIKGVLEYAERPTGPGLYLMDTPGREVDVLTGLAAAGAQVIVFTTGIGVPQGFPIAPVIKVCGNPKTCEHLKCHIDIDVSGIIEGRESIPEAGNRIFEEILKVASHKRTKAEILGYDKSVDIYTTGPII